MMRINIKNTKIWAHKYCIVFYLLSANAKSAKYLNDILTSSKSGNKILCYKCKNEKSHDSIVKVSLTLNHIIKVCKKLLS